MKHFSISAFFLLVILNAAFSQVTSTEDQIIQTLNSFTQAIVVQDSETASKLLAEDIRILEGGGVETKQEYLSHHFHSDGSFLSAIDRSVDSRSVFIEGSTAWVTTQSHLHGTYNDRQVSLTSLELAVLRKIDDQWKITALHWSSSSRK